MRSVIRRLLHIHVWEPKLSKYVSFNSRDILYECKCGKGKIKNVYRNFDTPFPIETTTMLTNKEMQDALLNREKRTCKTCRFGTGGKYELCWVGTYYAEQGKDRVCVEGELWEPTEHQHIDQPYDKTN